MKVGGHRNLTKTARAGVGHEAAAREVGVMRGGPGVLVITRCKLILWVRQRGRLAPVNESIGRAVQLHGQGWRQATVLGCREDAANAIAKSCGAAAKACEPKLGYLAQGLEDRDTALRPPSSRLWVCRVIREDDPK